MTKKPTWPDRYEGLEALLNAARIDCDDDDVIGLSNTIGAAGISGASLHKAANLIRDARLLRDVRRS